MFKGQSGGLSAHVEGSMYKVGAAIREVIGGTEPMGSALETIFRSLTFPLNEEGCYAGL